MGGGVLGLVVGRRVPGQSRTHTNSVGPRGRGVHRRDV